MTSALNFYPYLTTTAQGSFSQQSTGVIQGVAMDDPSTRFALAGGLLAASETLPMWGGVGIFENIPVGGYNPLGGAIGRATDYANLTGFSVFNQNSSMVITSTNPVPLTSDGGQVNFFRFGSGARIALQIDPSLISLDNQLITSQVSWDFTNQRIVAFNTTALPVRILDIFATNCLTVNYNSGSGIATWNNSGACAVVLI